jgi:dTMP kinase
MTSASSVPIPSGLLVIIEGIDGAGKTTQVQRLRDALQARRYGVTCTKEPTTGPHGTALRNSAITGRLAPADELRLFLADRREHIRDVLQPALDAGHVVIVDRYYLSNAAYQGAAGLDPEDILQQNEAFALIPDVAFILDCPVDTGLARIASRGDKANHFEGRENLERVQTIFTALQRPYIRHVDATVGTDAVTDVLLDEIQQRLDAKMER